MMREFARIVLQAGPSWFLLENVPNVPHLAVHGFDVQRIYASSHEFGGRQRRERVFQFGYRPGDVELVLLRRMLSRPGPWARTITTKDTHRNFADLCELQGLPRAFTISGFSRTQQVRAVANGVPVFMAQAIAEAIRDRAIRSHWLAVCGLRTCDCGCGRVCAPWLWGQRAGGVACRKRIERSRRGPVNGRVTVKPAAVTNGTAVALSISGYGERRAQG
jgi:DNA (cytosine-5)-methyltransferase 1